MIEVFLAVTTFIYAGPDGVRTESFSSNMFNYQDCKDWVRISDMAALSMPLVNPATGEPLLARFASCVLVPSIEDIREEEDKQRT